MFREIVSFGFIFWTNSLNSMTKNWKKNNHNLLFCVTGNAMEMKKKYHISHCLKESHIHVVKNSDENIEKVFVFVFCLNEQLFWFCYIVTFDFGHVKFFHSLFILHCNAARLFGAQRVHDSLSFLFVFVFLLFFTERCSGRWKKKFD